MSALLSLAEAAERLGCSPRTVRRRVQAGELAHFRDRGILRVPETALARYVAARTTRERLTASPAPARRSAMPRRGIPGAGRLWESPDPLAPP